MGARISGTRCRVSRRAGSGQRALAAVAHFVQATLPTSFCGRWVLVRQLVESIHQCVILASELSARLVAGVFAGEGTFAGVGGLGHPAGDVPRTPDNCLLFFV
jgi:hypothetical protein